MNLKVVEEYTGFGDVASGLRVFLERLKAKSENFDEYVRQIDAMFGKIWKKKEREREKLGAYERENEISGILIYKMEIKRHNCP
ncbi:hypothetical protein HanIR_Chr17g0865291 [Helianthus annuus]|nr:hypothetical protein HanIR_Chr17g0865291 [Helianthus annuus]